MLENVKLDISGYSSITFQDYRLHWSSSFLMAQLKQNWQYRHCCTVCEGLFSWDIGSHLFTFGEDSLGLITLAIYSTIAIV